MAGLNTTAADAVLKDLYEGPVRDQLNRMSVLTEQVTRNKKDFEGRRAVVPLRVTRNTGVGARLEGEVMPAAGRQGYTTVYIDTKVNVGRVRWTQRVISKMKSDKGSFIRATNSEMDGLKDDLGRDYNRQLWGSADGKIATCGTTSASTTVTLASTTTEQTLVNIAEGMRIDIGTVANPQSVASNRLVTSVDFSAKTIVIDGAAVTTAGTDFIFRQGSGGDGANQREVTGVQKLVRSGGTDPDADDTLFNVATATYWQWRSVVEHNSGTARPISENLLSKAMHRSQNRSGKKVNLLIAEDGVYRAYANLLQAQKRIVNTQELKGGHSGLAVDAGGHTAVLTRDRDCPTGKIYGFTTDVLYQYVLEDWQFLDTDGNTLRLATDGSMSFEAAYFNDTELATSQRNAHFRLDDITTA